MAAMKPITIVGGGLAGLTLGIGLRQRGLPVTLWRPGVIRAIASAASSSAGAARNTRAAGFARLARTRGRGRRGHGGLLFRNPIHRAAAAAGTGHLPFAFHPGRHAGGEIRELGGELRVGQRWPAVGVHASACPDGLKPELQPEGVRSRHGPALAAGGERGALVRVESARAQRSAHGRPRNARFTPGLCRFMPGQRWHGECLRIIPPGRRRKCRAAKPARIVARTNGFAVAPAAGFG